VYLLDSNHAGTLVTIGHPIRDRMRAGTAAGDIFYVTVLTITEVVFGFSTLPRSVQNQREWQQVRPTLGVLVPDEDDAFAAAALQLTLRREGRQLATIDAFIAVCALRYGLTLLTSDRDFAPIHSLNVENWMSPRRR
jgi:predicted nucleic acid-binding protein